MIVLDLLHNLALLVALAVVCQLIEARWRTRRVMSQFLRGLLFGMVGVVGMMTPVHFMPGIIFDGRSIILSVGGLFGGPVVALISALMCGVYRLWLGGAGAAMGLSVIFESAALGVAFYYWRRRVARPLGLQELWGFGLLVHGVMLGLMLLLPGGARQAAWNQLSLAIIGVYPVVMMLICRLFLDYEKQRHDRTALEESEDKFKCFFEHSNVGTSITRPAGEMQVNQAFCDLLGYSRVELQHQSWQAITHPEDREPTQRVLDLLLSRKQNSARFTQRFLHKNGSVVWTDISTALRLDPAGQPLYFMMAVIDITERKRAEMALRESNTLLSSFMQHSPILAYIKEVTPAESRVLLASDSFQQMVGMPGSAMVGKTMADLFPAEFGAKITADDWAVVAGGEVLTVDEDLNGRNYTTIKFPIVQEGRMLLAGYTIDITERKKAEAEIRETAERLHLAQRAARFGIWDHDFKTQRSVWTVEQESLFGFAPGTYDGTSVPFDQLLHPDDRPRMAQAIARARETGTFDLEFRATQRDGVLRWFAGHGQIYRDAAGQPARMIGINLDITDHKRTEEQLREQAALLDAANDAIYVRTMDHTVIYWNAGAERLYGWPRAEALGRKITDMGNAGSAGFAAAHAALLEQGHWSGELTKTSKAGKELVVFCRWTLLRDEQGRPREVLAINTDITKQKQMEANFLRAQRMEGIGALAGGIAHDLNNILAPILMVGPLLRETISDPEGQQMLNTVESCARRGADIIKQLLTFARGQPGVRAPLPVRHLLNEMHKLILETFPRNIQSRVNVPKDLWLILGDATQIHQALMNLCVNARDALPEGGTLTLAAENVTLDQTAAALAPEAKPGEYVRVSVTDTGAGIPPEIMDHIFDPFFTTKEIGKGTGLGLATVLGIVRGHGGFVSVSSRVGQGTTVELHLPASPEAKAAGTPDPEALPPRGQGELILVVDDEAPVREIAQLTLENYGYRVIAAREGAEALALLVEHRDVKAAITDMMMPGMDGPKLVQALRQLDPRLPILGMTGLAERAGVKDLEALNLPGVLNKPFTAVDLLAAVSQVLAGSRPNPQASPGQEPGPQ